MDELMRDIGGHLIRRARQEWQVTEVDRWSR